MVSSDFIMRRKEVIFVGVAIIAIIAALLSRPEIRARLFHPGGTVVPGPEGFPSYYGRALREWRPTEAETRVFSREQLGELEKQLNDWANAIDANPDQLDPWIRVGLIKKNIGDYEGAREAWEYASVIRPKNFVSFYNLGGLYWHELPDYARAEENFRTAIANEPTFVDSYISLSDMYRYSYPGKSSMADKPLLEGIENNPKSVSLMSYLAGYYKAIGNREGARAWYQKALAEDPQNQAIREELQAF